MCGLSFHKLCSVTKHFLEYMQFVVWRFLQRSNGSDVLATKQALFFIILLQYIPRFTRIMPLSSELKRTSGVFAETAWAGAVSYLLLYMLASHVSFFRIIIKHLIPLPGMMGSKFHN